MTVFLRRMGQLTQLRFLDLQPGCYFFDTQPNALPWPLVTGFKYLDQWMQLEVIDFGADYDLPLGILELPFMRQHWTSLKSLFS
ncbi:hypothetical protein BGZ73_000837, partial [Actinomortierella ambigua]